MCGAQIIVTSESSPEDALLKWTGALQEHGASCPVLFSEGQILCLSRIHLVIYMTVPPYATRNSWILFLEAGPGLSIGSYMVFQGFPHSYCASSRDLKKSFGSELKGGGQQCRVMNWLWHILCKARVLGKSWLSPFAQWEASHMGYFTSAGIPFTDLRRQEHLMQLDWKCQKS